MRRIAMLLCDSDNPYERALAEAGQELVAAVMPDQRQVGQVQGEQCLRLDPEGGVVLLVTGMPETSSASLRRAGFLDRVGPPAYEVHELDGRWNVTTPWPSASAPP